MSSEDSHDLPEGLLNELCEELGAALNSLGGRDRDGLLEAFKGYSAKLIGWAASGYCVLKHRGMVDSARLLVRPAIEALFKIQAVRKEPDLLFRIAYTEHREQEKWRRMATGMSVEDSRREFDRVWGEVKEAYTEKYPEHNQVENEISTMATAEAADGAAYYNSHYRLYCQFTHATLHASSGSLDDLSHHDDPAMAICIVCALETVVEIGGDAPNLESLRERLFSAAGVSEEEE